jgi:hypothetical protein
MAAKKSKKISSGKSDKVSGAEKKSSKLKSAESEAQKSKMGNNTSRAGFNRYNVFQAELSAYLKEAGSDSKDFRKYRKLYSKIDKNTPVKAFQAIFATLIPLKGAKTTKSLNYTANFPFYNARAEFLTPRYDGVTLRVRFNDGGLSLDWKGTSNEFASWFSGDVIAYFRNNYNDSPPAEFVFTGGNDELAEYEIQVNGSAYGSPSYIEPDKTLTVADKQNLQKDAEMQKLLARERVLDKELLLIKRYRELGFSNDEIKQRLKEL